MNIKFSGAGSGGLYCVDDDTYDGAVDSGIQAIGHGFNKHDAFMDFAEQWAIIHYNEPAKTTEQNNG